MSSVSVDSPLDRTSERANFLREALDGLQQSPQKLLPCKYLYDERGSSLFDDICELPEYFPTRTEAAILDANIDEIIEEIGAKAALIEYGSGSSTKTRLLLDAHKTLACYVPIDISREHLARCAEELKAAYPDLDIRPVCADYTQPFDLPQLPPETTRRVVFFPGSTIGNFHQSAAVEFLARIARVVGSKGRLLIGVGLKIDPSTLESAYDDAAGVTAAFNMNLLSRMNEELDTDFNLDQFEHRAVWNEKEGRIEMHLVSKTAQKVQLGDKTITFAEGESIRTECSYKYAPHEFDALAEKAGYELDRGWVDPKKRFRVAMYQVK